jgi:hypothetical protein
MKSGRESGQEPLGSRVLDGFDDRERARFAPHDPRCASRVRVAASRRSLFHGMAVKDIGQGQHAADQVVASLGGTAAAASRTRR